MLSNFICGLYGIKFPPIRKLISVYINRIEGGQLYSPTLRKIFSKYYCVDVGLYSMGGCFKAKAFDKHTKVGRYSSIAMSAMVLNRNHPMDLKSTHGFFFNPKLNVVKEDKNPYIPLEIGSDVWIGERAIIMPHVTRIGHGAIIGAGVVVNKDVPPYAVLVGNPARIVRYRFTPEVIEKLLEEKWWEGSLDDVKKVLSGFTSQKLV